MGITLLGAPFTIALLAASADGAGFAARDTTGAQAPDVEYSQKGRVWTRAMQAGGS
jgi:hypothetical protein